LKKISLITLTLVMMLMVVTVVDAAEKIVFAIPGEVQVVNSYQELIDEFNADHDDIYVELIAIPETDYDQKIQTMIAGDAELDIFGTGDVMFPALVEKGIIKNLQPFVEKDNFDLSPFYDEVIDFFRIDEDLYAISDNWDVEVMYYNKDLFDEAGLDYPDASWNWEDLLANAKKLTKGEGRRKHYGLMFDPWFVPVFQAIWQNGGRIIAEDQSESLINEPAAREALQWINDLFNKYEVSPSPNGLDKMGMDPGMIFTSGNVAMLVGSGRWMVPPFNESDINWSVSPLPQGKEKAVFFHLPAYVMAEKSDHSEAAWEFMKYLLSEEAQKKIAVSGNGIPVRKSVATSDMVLNTPIVKEHNSIQPFIDSLSMTHQPPQLVNWWEVVDQLNELDNLWRGKYSVEEVTEIIKEKMDKALQSQ